MSERANKVLIEIDRLLHGLSNLEVLWILFFLQVKLVYTQIKAIEKVDRQRQTVTSV